MVSREETGPRESRRRGLPIIDAERVLRGSAEKFQAEIMDALAIVEASLALFEVPGQATAQKLAYLNRCISWGLEMEA
jgi:hypothetical protein